MGLLEFSDRILRCAGLATTLARDPGAIHHGVPAKVFRCPDLVRLVRLPR